MPKLRIVDVSRGLDCLHALGVEITRERNIEFASGWCVGRDYAVCCCQEYRRSDQASGAPLIVTADTVLVVIEQQGAHVAVVASGGNSIHDCPDTARGSDFARWRFRARGNDSDDRD